MSQNAVQIQPTIPMQRRHHHPHPCRHLSNEMRIQKATVDNMLAAR